MSLRRFGVLVQILSVLICFFTRFASMLAILRRLKWVMGGCAPRLAWFDRQSFARRIFSDILALGAAMGGGCEHHSEIGKRYARVHS